MTTATASTPSGLAGISAGQTAICSVEQGELIYRGYAIDDLAEKACFEEVAFLLIEGHKPSKEELERFRAELIGARPLPNEVIDYLLSMRTHLRDGHAAPMDVLRTAVSLLGNLNPSAQKIDADAETWKSKRLLARIPTIIGHMQNIIDGRELVGREEGGDSSLSHAANMLYLMSGEKPSAEAERVMDLSLTLYAEHDFNASTFTARVIAATLSDLHGSITGAIAALKGPLHGGANEAAMDMMLEIKNAVGTGTSVEQWMDNAFAEKRKLMGFGHRVYKNGDHRAPILHALGRKVAEAQADKGNGYYLEMFELGEQVMKIMLDKKGLHPNVDFPCGLTYFTLGIPVPQYTPIFVAARVSGWAAHVIEQHANNKLIRPLAEYNGPAPRQWNA